MPKPNLSALDSALNFDDDEHDVNASIEATNNRRLQELEDALLAQSLEAELETTVLRLSDFLAAVEMTIKHTFDHSVWVKAEIRNLSSKGGHYYFELAEKDDDGKVIASCRGTLWRFKAKSVLAKFERATGMLLSRDLTVLLKIRPNFHPQYGFSLNIEDIDPSYTLGDLAQQYAAMIDKLTGEGLLRLNAKLPTPFDIQHVIVIAPEKAAGLGDFKADADRLAATNACQFYYHHATFQGNHAPKEIREAITTGMAQFKKDHQRLPDIMVIIRGGGAVGDLAYLNDYELAALVAEQPVPVWVGIGHERDRVVLDEVAQQSFDTPSKVIAAISKHLAVMANNAISYQKQIHTLAQRQITLADQRSKQNLSQIQAKSASQISRFKVQADYAYADIQKLAMAHIKQAKNSSHHAMQSIYQAATGQITQAAAQSHVYKTTVYQYAKLAIEQRQSQSEHLRDMILLQHPKRVLNQGYALLKDAQTGTLLTSTTQLNAQQNINIIFKDGQAEATITAITFDNSKADTPNRFD